MVRITGGAWRGRRLEVPGGIRPTTELARKAAFDILGDAIRGARVLDACAGSGAYGLEALSRGAAHATFVEADRKVGEVLRGNVERLGAATRSRLDVTSVERFSLKGEEGRAARRVGGAALVSMPIGDAPPVTGFDVIFHDPPFEEISSESQLSLLMPIVRAGGWLFHERGDDRAFSPGGRAPADARRYGLTRFLIYRP
jgi:16S rRNA (guanine966-N2)-methyltransferase